MDIGALSPNELPFIHTMQENLLSGEGVENWLEKRNST